MDLGGFQIVLFNNNKHNISVEIKRCNLHYKLLSFQIGVALTYMFRPFYKDGTLYLEQ